MGDGVRAGLAGGVREEGEPQSNYWTVCFRFTNRYVVLQIFLYVFIFYQMIPSCNEVGPLLVCLLVLLPMSVLNLIGTHVLVELAAKRKKRGLHS